MSTRESGGVASGENGTRWQPIVKDPARDGLAPHLRDYWRTWAEFSWDEARRHLDGLPGGAGLNIAHEAVDRHTAGLRGNRLALRWISRTGVRRDFRMMISAAPPAASPTY
jgi:acetyl-CoA synthetase